MESINKKDILGGNLQQLQQLLNEVSVADSGQVCSTEVSVEALDCFEDVLPTLSLLQRSDLDDAQNIVQAIEFSQFDESAVISADLHAKLLFADRVFAKLVQHCSFDEQLLQDFKRLRIPFIKLALLDDSIYVDHEHYARNFFNDLCAVGVTWYSGLGKSGQMFSSRVLSMISTIVGEFEDDPNIVRESQQAFTEYLSKELQTSERLEKRLCESQAGTIRAKRADHTVLKFLNDSLAGKLLPPVVVEFLQVTWRGELRYLLINEGSQSDLWRRWKKIIETIVWCFQPDKSEEDKQRLYSIVPALGKELHRNIEAVSRNPREYDVILESLEASFIQALKGQTPDFITAPPLIIPDDLDGVETIVSQALLKKAESLEEGTWLLYRGEDQESFRCKLALRIPDTDQLLFVNRNGQKVMQKGIENFAFCLSTKIAQPLSQQPLFVRCFSEALDEIIKSYNKKQMVFQEEKNRLAEAERERQLKLEEALARDRVEEQAIIAAAQKAQREAQALAEAREAVQRMREERVRLAEADKQREAQVHEEEQREDSLRVVKLSVDSLRIGAWVEMPDTKGELVKCKLAVMMSSTGKHIFVDRIGVKVTECHRKDLIEMISSGQAKIIEQGSHFEERLAKVVGGMRREHNK